MLRHREIPGNEAADVGTKAAHTSPTIFNIPYSRTAVGATVKAAAKHVPSSLWAQPDYHHGTCVAGFLKTGTLEVLRDCHCFRSEWPICLADL